MNHSYRLVYNRALGAWVAAPETAASRGRGGRLCRAAVAVAAILAVNAHALPTGGAVTAGAASVVRNGASLVVQQASPNATLQWNSFDIAPGETVTFVQPGATSLAVNRVMGGNPSAIHGQLKANGRLFLLNPGGIVFGAGAQVNVGSFLASTLDASDADLASGRFRFAGRSGARVVNQGRITAADGGHVVLLGARVSNEGVISARLGTVALAAGQQVSLDFAGDKLLNVVVDQGALDALAHNQGLLKADGGTVLMTARGAGALLSTVVNNQGVLEAHTAQNQGGVIKLLGDLGSDVIQVGGRLDASAPSGGDGGFIDTSAAKVKLVGDLAVTTAAARGRTGTWLIDPSDYTIGAGGDITGAQLTSMLASTNVEIQSSSGGTAGHGDIHVNQGVSWNANTLTLTAARDINVNAVMSATGTASLELNTGTANGADAGVAGGTVNMALTGSGFTGRVDFTSSGPLKINGEQYIVIHDVDALQAMRNDLNGRYALGSHIEALATAGWNEGAGFVPIGMGEGRFGGHFDGLGHRISSLTLRNFDAGAGLFVEIEGATLRNVGMGGAMIRGFANVGVLAGASWYSTITNAYATFSDVRGAGHSTGGLVGAAYASAIRNAHTSGSIIGNSEVGGLVGTNGGSAITNAYSKASVSGSDTVGGLVGANYNSTVANSYATGIVTAQRNYSGGLVGSNFGGVISDAYATGKVSGHEFVGGLVGENEVGGLISNTYAAGNVTNLDALIAGNHIGGLVGSNNGSSITRSYATGAVSGRNMVGGLVGSNLYGTISHAYASGNVAEGGIHTAAFGGLAGLNSHGTITYAYATGRVTTNTAEVGGLVGRNEYGTITGAYASGSLSGYDKVGGLVGYNESPVTTDGFWNTESTGQATSAGGTGKTTAEMMQLATFAGWDIDDTGGTGKTWRIYEGQSTPLLRSLLTPLTVTAESGSRSYDGTTHALGVSFSTTINDNLLGSLALATASRHVGSYAVAPSGLYSKQQGFDIRYVGGTVAITPAPLTITTGSVRKVYDGTTSAEGSAVATGGTQVFAGDTLSGGSFAFTDKNAGTGKRVDVSGVTVQDGNGGANYHVTYQPDTSSTIDKAPLTITADDKTRTYGNATPGLTATYDGLVGGDTRSVVRGLRLTTDATAASGVGSYAIHASGATAANYDIQFGPGTLTVNPAVLTVKAAGQVRYYGDANLALTASVSGWKNGDSAELLSGLVLSTTANELSNVGSYPITVSSAGAGPNYTVQHIDSTLNVRPAPLIVRAVGQSRYYGDANRPLTFSHSGFKLADTVDLLGQVSLSTDADATSGAGDYAIRISGGQAGPNYHTIYRDGTLRVKPAPLLIRAASQSRVYGDANAPLSATVTGLKNGELAGDVVTGLQLNTDASQASNVGSYTIVPSGANAGANYVIAYRPGTLSINRAPLTIAADSKVRARGQANPELTATITGMKNADTAEVVSGLVLSTTATAASPIGNYTIRGSGASAGGNYAIRYVNGLLSVVAAMD